MIVIGIDLVSIQRVKKVVSLYGSSFINKVFTENEIIFCESKANKFKHYAVRFAAKEALLKAVGIGIQNVQDLKEVEVIKSNKGQVSLKLYGDILSNFESKGYANVTLSLSHELNFALASVLIY